MEIRTTPKGTLYGKTGSGSSSDGKSNIGWFVGFSESGGKTFAFATCLQGKNSSGAEARTLSETILQRLELL
jgi:beta-lactamase class D